MRSAFLVFAALTEPDYVISAIRQLLCLLDRRASSPIYLYEALCRPKNECLIPHWRIILLTPEGADDTEVIVRPAADGRWQVEIPTGDGVTVNSVDDEREQSFSRTRFVLAPTFECCAPQNDYPTERWPDREWNSTHFDGSLEGNMLKLQVPASRVASGARRSSAHA
ncbi:MULTISPECIES: hypothetical protein [unclassified Caballeronia]|uniref:hypothetical protein n=1 Tax=unclassified Caballeronia TaxID=2646786 RepID=UPI00285DB764|nr:MULTISPECIES: hypothetical protein [unclassified Caballeronia]MDR5777437.1 hypothetical protein [Caballeronia sp. LZ002]MDR5852875.1 hypothetical protein [Caballeronia sp. LZ003]